MDNEKQIGTEDTDTDNNISIREKENKGKKPGTAKSGRGDFPAFLSSLPRFAKIFYALALLCALLMTGFALSESFADLFNRRVSSLLRAALAYLTGWIPFSFAEYFVILLPVILVFLVRIAIKNNSDSWKDVAVYCTSMISVLALLFSVFTIGFAPGYHGSTLDKKLGIERADVSAQELYDTAQILTEGINREIPEIIFIKEGFSVMPYDFGEMNDKLIEAFDKACDKYDFLQRLDSNLKTVMLSKPMSYTHITGVYTFFTGEANINVDFPDYTIPYTAAHELAHQRGIAREDEANFMAFLVCMESDDHYIRYSAYLSLYEYVSSALHSADSTLYQKVYSHLDDEAKYEMKAYSEFFEQYRDSVASNVSESVNDTFLQIQGTPGSVSYGMVVDLAVAYYKHY